MNGIVTVLLSTFFLTTSPSFANSQKTIKSNSKAQASQTGVSTRFKKIESGDTIYGLLRKHGFTQNQIGQVMSHQLPFDKFTLVPGEKYRIRTTAQSKELKFYRKPSNEVFLLWKNTERAGAQLRTEKFEVRHKSVQGKVVGSLVASISQKIPDKWIAYRFMDAYAFDYKLPKVLQKGAEFSLTFEEKYDDGVFIGYGEVLATHLEIYGEKQSRYLVRHGDAGSFVGLESLDRSRPLYAPVSYVRVSSHYNPRRKHPIKRYRIPHWGTDFELDAGEDVFAANGGKVLRTGKNRAAGRYIVIRHAGGLESYYNHLKSIESNIKPGVRVANGQKIGEIGCSGYCTKPHLHFAVKKAGRFVDPIKYLKSYPASMEAVISRKIASLGKDS